MKSVDSICSICDISIMSDHDDRIFRLSVEYIDKIHDLQGIPFVEISCRLICEKIRDICDESSCYRHTLLLSSWELSRKAVSLPSESDFLDDLIRIISSFCMRNIKDQVDILWYGKIRDKLECLKYESNILSTILDASIRSKFRDISISQNDRSSIWRYNTSYKREDRRFPCSTRTHKSYEFSWSNLPIKISKKSDPLIARSIRFGNIF